MILMFLWSCLGKNTTSKFAKFWEYKKTQNKTLLGMKNEKKPLGMYFGFRIPKIVWKFLKCFYYIHNVNNHKPLIFEAVCTFKKRKESYYFMTYVYFITKTQTTQRDPP